MAARMKNSFLHFVFFLSSLQLYLWDFVDRREFHWLEILSNFTDSGDSDWSEDFE